MLDVLQALLTPTIAVVTTYIAYQQYRIRRDERSLALYDRRLAIYKNAVSALDLIRAGKPMTSADAFEWAASVAEAQFIFGEEIQAVLGPLFGAIYDFAVESEPTIKGHPYSIACANAALHVEEFRSPLMAVVAPYLRPAGSPQRRKPRLSLSQVEALLPKPKAEPSSNDEIPF